MAKSTAYMFMLGERCPRIRYTGHMHMTVGEVAAKDGHVPILKKNLLLKIFIHILWKVCTSIQWTHLCDCGRGRHIYSVKQLWAAGRVCKQG